MCTEDLADPYNKLPCRKRTKLNHTSGILAHLLTKYRQCPGDHNHQPIEGMTRYKDSTGRWRTINRSTFAGWYTRPFCEDVVDSFTQEFAIRDHMELKHGRMQQTVAPRKCVRFRLPNQTLTTKVPNARHGGAYIPTFFYSAIIVDLGSAPSLHA